MSEYARLRAEWEAEQEAARLQRKAERTADLAAGIVPYRCIAPKAGTGSRCVKTTTRGKFCVHHKWLTPYIEDIVWKEEQPIAVTNTK